MPRPCSNQFSALLFSALTATLLLAHLSYGQTKTIWLDELDITGMTCGHEHPRINRTINGNAFRIARKRYERGVGTHAESWFAVDTGGNALEFQATVGLDDEELNRGRGSVIFRIYADERLVADSGIMRPRQPAVVLRADIAGAKRVILHVSDAGDSHHHDHADWCEAFFTMKPGGELKPVTTPLSPQMGILTPPAPKKPRINAPRVFGARPGNPVLFTVPASGARPMTFEADNLPAGLTINPRNGFISGSIKERGSYEIALRASNSYGETNGVLHLKVGDELSLTPPMGWNHWNRFADKVRDHDIRQAAKAMVDKGLLQYGWSYVNIDDYWQTCPSEREDLTLQGPPRDAHGDILPNPRFPDMPALCTYVHSLGLKIGLYSSPGPLTCGQCIGSHGHVEQDVRRYAAWGFDYLKYDWCSYAQIAGGTSLKKMMRPYLEVSRALRKQPRDIVLSICQYGMANVSAWGRLVGGQCWRTTLDIDDTWASVMEIADAQDGLELFAGPGGWNDPDMLVIGTVGWGAAQPSRLTINQQYAHFSLWCMLNAPLMLGCDLAGIDPLTLSMLTNAEVLEVNQDPLGSQAVRLIRNDAMEVWAKPMQDGSMVAGLFNRGALPSTLTLEMATLDLHTPRHLRDLWRQQELGLCDGQYTTTLPGYGVALLRLYQPGARHSSLSNNDCGL